jgi:hypothetical protein
MVNYTFMYVKSARLALFHAKTTLKKNTVRKKIT